MVQRYTGGPEPVAHDPGVGLAMLLLLVWVGLLLWVFLQGAA